LALLDMTSHIDEWEDDGGATASSREGRLIGTVNQIALAEEIRVRMTAEFDRVRATLESAACTRAGQRRSDVEMMIAILEEKRVQEMSSRRAGHYIHRWSELRHQVRDLILRDPRYRALNRRHA
jgi:hypothetical protein